MIENPFMFTLAVCLVLTMFTTMLLGLIHKDKEQGPPKSAFFGVACLILIIGALLYGSLKAPSGYIVRTEGVSQHLR